MDRLDAFIVEAVLLIGTSFPLSQSLGATQCGMLAALAQLQFWRCAGPALLVPSHALQAARLAHIRLPSPQPLCVAFPKETFHPSRVEHLHAH